jgi:copper/silver efflux system protein
MIAGFLRGVIRFRMVVLTLVAFGVAASVYAVQQAPLDAIPDISDPQVVIYVKWARSPQLLESEVTEPLIRALAGSPDIQSIRGTSHMGYSFIYVILEDVSRREAVRQLVLDRVSAIRPQLPPDAIVTLGPNASSMGWIYQYALTDSERLRDLRELRILNESQIKPALQAVQGIAEVASVGGLEKQYQVKLFPPLLAARGISLRQVMTSLQAVFQEVGGRTIEVTNREYQLRGSIASGDVGQLAFIVVGRGADGAAVQLKDVGYVQVGYDLRRSTSDLDGEGEVVGGIVVMEQDQNVLAVTRALDQKLEEVRAGLPQGVELVTTYNRSSWIWATLMQFFETLGAELIVLIAVTLLFLRNLRSSVGPIAILLLSTLFTVLPLVLFRQTINLFSLAGLCIAIGAIEDATIVIIENCAAELAAHPGLGAAGRREVVLRSIANVLL